MDWICKCIARDRDPITFETTLEAMNAFAREWGMTQRDPHHFYPHSVFLLLVTFYRRTLHFIRPKDAVSVIDALSWVDSYRVDSLEYRALVLSTVKKNRRDAIFREGLRQLVLSSFPFPPRAHFLLGTLADEILLEHEWPHIWPALKQFLADPVIAERAQQLIAFAFHQHVNSIRGDAKEILATKPCDAVVVRLLEDLDFLEAKGYAERWKHPCAPPVSWKESWREDTTSNLPEEVMQMRNARYRVLHAVQSPHTGRFLELALWPDALRRAEVDLGDTEKADLVLGKLAEKWSML